MAISDDFAILFGNSRVEAKSFVVPVGIYPRQGLLSASNSISPFTASFKVPSPPDTTIRSNLSPLFFI